MSRIRESGYALIARSLRDRILRGDFGDGRRLPTEAELAEEFGVSRQTVRRAFQDLVAEQLVYRVPGRGTFARHHDDGYVRQFGSVADLMALAEDTAMQVVTPLARTLDPGHASRLALASDVIYTVRFVRQHEGVVFCTTSAYLPPDIGMALAGIPELTTVGSVSPLTIIGRIDQQVPIAQAQQSITAVSASGHVAADLGCAEGEPVLRVDRRYFDAFGTCLELAISHFLPERYAYRINLLRNS